jgi:hypothetical protein
MSGDCQVFLQKSLSYSIELPPIMVQMAARYAHFTLEELRGAVEPIGKRGRSVEANAETHFLIRLLLVR